MSELPVLVTKRDGIHTITLNRPAQLNAFTEAMHIALAVAFDDAGKDPTCRAIIVTGNGKGFCAGQDLAENFTAAQAGGNAKPDAGARLDKYYNPLMRAIHRLPQPVICAVNGVAAGAGANFALQCDFVVAARSAKFLQAFAKLGLVPDAGGTWLLPRLVGSARARGLAMLAEPLSAEDAERWGLIWKCVDDDKLMEEAESICRRLAALPADGLTRIKRIMDASETNSHDAQLDLERDTQREAGHDPDFREAVAAFVEKRAPKFKR